MDSIFLQILNGLDKGGAYALIALGLTLVLELWVWLISLTVRSLCWVPSVL